MQPRVSPYGAGDDKKDEDGDLSFWSNLNCIKWVEERFEKDVFFCYTTVTTTFPFIVKAFSTALWKFLWFFVAIYIATQYYINDQNGLYISLQFTPGSCVEVPIAIFGTWTIDRDGNWLGNSQFESTEGFVSVSLFDLTITTADFALFMDRVRYSVDVAAQISSTRELADNLAYLMTFQLSIPTLDLQGRNSTQKIAFTADAAFVFDRFYRVATLSDSDSDCDVFIDVGYDRATAVVTAQLPFADFSSSAICNETVSPAHVGYIPHRSGPNIKLQFDMHALVLAYSINIGLVPFSTLYAINDPTLDTRRFVHNGDVYGIAIGIEGKYPGMEPVYCLTPISRSNPASSYNFDNICLIQVGETFVYPFFNHIGISGFMGYDIYTPKQCDCDDGTGLHPQCSAFDFLVGFIMFEEPSLELTALHVLDMVTELEPDDINDMAYNASFAGIVLETSPSFANPLSTNADPAAKALLRDPAWRAGTYAFCQNCSILSMNFYDKHNNRVNADGLQLHNGSCRDVISPDGAGWLNMPPPTKLVHDYYECRPSVYDSVINGIGIGTSDAALFVPTLIVFMVPLIHFILYFVQSKKSKLEEIERFNQVSGLEPHEVGENGPLLTGWVYPKQKGPAGGAKEISVLTKEEQNL